MTGRRLYDLLCDEWARNRLYERERAPNLLRVTPPAWPFLEPAERSTLNRTAERSTPKRRR